MNLSRRTLIIGLAASGAIAPTALWAKEPDVFQTDGVAINGTDPVVYFTDGKADSIFNRHRAQWNGAEWHFDNSDNAAAFIADPEAYAPVFGGYCAYAASLGYLAKTVSEAWTIYEGKLYLNASLRARDLWRQDIPGNIAKGLANWPAILG